MMGWFWLVCVVFVLACHFAARARLRWERRRNQQLFQAMHDAGFQIEHAGPDCVTFVNKTFIPKGDRQ
jgi:hypothetical protein